MTEPGFVADARAVNTLSTNLDNVNSNLSDKANKSDLQNTAYALAFNDTYLSLRSVSAWKNGNIIVVSGTIRPTITGNDLNLITLGEAPKSVIKAPIVGGTDAMSYCEVNGKNIAFNIPTANKDYRFTLVLPM